MAKISVEINGLAGVQRMLDRVSFDQKDRAEIHKRWAILALNWINKNFQTEGGLVGGWKKLSPNTLAGRRKGSGRILQDTGEMRGSFVPRWNSEEASVGSPLARSEWHERGTRPYTIRPKKPGGVLRFKMATSTGVKTKTLASGRSITLNTAKGDFVYRRSVNHPGLAARRMLPGPNEPSLMADLTKAVSDYVRAQEAGSAKG